MKEIRAYIKTHKLPDVVSFLEEDEHIVHYSISQNYIPEGLENLLEEIQDYVKIEILCCTKYVDSIVEDIRTFAGTGLKNDGKILVFSAEKVFDISD